ncbi:MAG: hypothetical protein ABIJ21_07615 [Nanoarchaeota archaeon]
MLTPSQSSRPSKYIPTLKKLEKKYRQKFEPNIQITDCSLWELKTGKRCYLRKKNSAAPSRFSKYIAHYKLIFGKNLDKDKFHLRSEQEDLTGMIKAFRTIFLPAYERQEMAFSELAKQVFWLAENEERFLGRKPPHHWKHLTESITDKNHIVHDALHIRQTGKGDKAAFVKKLDKYLARLERL